jgi:hypothetical protein
MFVYFLEYNAMLGVWFFNSSFIPYMPKFGPAS